MVLYHTRLSAFRILAFVQNDLICERICGRTIQGYDTLIYHENILPTKPTYENIRILISRSFVCQTCATLNFDLGDYFLFPFPIGKVHR